MVHKIIRNVKGLSGFHLAEDCFSEDVEQRLFFSFGTTNFSKQEKEENKIWRRFFDITSEKWDDDIHRLCNIFKDCGLCPHLAPPPDCCLQLTYPPSAPCSAHIDGSHRWGEVAVGVSLGQERVMRFTPSYRVTTVHISVDVHLPRRSIFILSESSRYEWNHEILKQNLMEVPPDWNKENHRRSLTFRSTKVFSHVYYEKRIETDPSNQELKTRFAVLKKYDFQFGGYRSPRYDEDHPLVQREKVKMNELLDRIDDGDFPVHIRFGPSELPYSQSSMISTVQSSSSSSASDGGEESSAEIVGDFYNLASSDDDRKTGTAPPKEKRNRSETMNSNDTSNNSPTLPQAPSPPLPICSRKKKRRATQITMKNDKAETYYIVVGSILDIDIGGMSLHKILNPERYGNFDCAKSMINETLLNTVLSESRSSYKSAELYLFDEKEEKKKQCAPTDNFRKLFASPEILQILLGGIDAVDLPTFAPYVSKLVRSMISEEIELHWTIRSNNSNNKGSSETSATNNESSNNSIMTPVNVISPFARNRM